MSEVNFELRHQIRRLGRSALKKLQARIEDLPEHYMAQLWCDYCQNNRRVQTCHLDAERYGERGGGVEACPACRPWKAPWWLLAQYVEWNLEGGKERDAERRTKHT